MTSAQGRTEYENGAGSKPRPSTLTWAILAAVAVAAVVLGLWWWQPWVGDDVENAGSPSPTATTTPTATAEAEPADEPALIEGFAPVPHLPAGSIVWDELEPGWFLVDYRTPTDEVAGGESAESFALAPFAGGFSLVSPAGDWYAVERREDVTGGLTLAWDGDRVWSTGEIGLASESLGFDEVESISLRTGEVQSADFSGEFAWVDNVLRQGFFAHGEGIVGLVYGGDGFSMKPYTVGGAELRTCDEVGRYHGAVFDDMSFLADGADGRLVCFTYTEDRTGSDVMLLPMTGTDAPELLATFQHPADRYSFLGWVDSDTFLFGRNDGSPQHAGTAVIEAVFSWEVSSGALTELDLPFAVGAEMFYDSASERFVVFAGSDDARTVALYTLEGDVVLEAPAACPTRWGSGDSTEFSNVHVSGDRLIVVCEAVGDVSLFDTGSGEPVGSWDLGTGHEVRPFEFGGRS